MTSAAEIGHMTPLQWDHTIQADCDVATVLDLDHVLCRDWELQSTCIASSETGRCTMERRGEFVRSIRVDGRDRVALFSAYPHVIGAIDGVVVERIRADRRRVLAEYPLAGTLLQSADGRCAAWATSDNTTMFHGSEGQAGTVTAEGWAFASPAWVGSRCVADELVLQVDRQVVTVSPDGAATQFGPEAKMWSSVGGCLVAWRLGDVWVHCDGGESTIELPPGLERWSIAGTPAGTRQGWLVVSSLDVAGVYAVRFDARTGEATSPWYTLPVDHPVRAYEPAIVGRHVCVPSLSLNAYGNVERALPQREPVRCFVVP